MEHDIRETTTTQLKEGLPSYKVSPKTIDEATSLQKETYWDNPNWTTYLGYYKTIPELKQSIDSLAMWVTGKGYITDNRTKIILENITGWGEDSFDTIMRDMVVVKKVNGDAFAEIIRNDKGTLINLKKLNPGRIRVVVNKKGIVVRYEELDAKSEEVKRKYEPSEILHLVNNRVANEIHGTSVVESCKWIIDARNEALSDFRRIMHRSTIRVLFVDEDDSSKISTYREQYKEAIKNGEVLIMPGKPSDASFQDLTPPASQAYMEWIRMLEDVFYRNVGVPKIILGGSQEYTEASSKVGYLTFEQVYMAEQRELEQDLWNQLAIKVKFERPVSLKEPIVEDEEKNTGQTGFQPSETKPTIMRNE